MKRLFVVVLMMSATISFALAQPGQGQRQMKSAEERAKSQVERMVTLMSLNVDQKTKIEAIELELYKEMDAKRQSAQGNREAMVSVFQEIDKARDDKYKTVLSADQFKKYIDDKENRPKRGQGERQGERQRERQGGGDRRKYN